MYICGRTLERVVLYKDLEYEKEKSRSFYFSFSSYLFVETTLAYILCFCPTQRVKPALTLCKVATFEKVYSTLIKGGENN